MVALVSTTEELATTSALVNITGGIASAIGSSFLAPILIKTTDIEVVIYVAGVLYLLGAVRAWRLPAIEQATSFTTAVHQVEWKPEALSIRRCGEWLVRNRSIGSIVLVGATAVAMFEAFNNLIPLYVKDVLNSDPANAIYIFAPAGIGYLVGAVFGPRFIHHWGERKLATIGVGMSAQALNVEVIAHNVANINTTSFKRSRAEFVDLLYQTQLAAGTPAAGGVEVIPEGARVGLGVRAAAIRNLHQQGALAQLGEDHCKVCRGKSTSIAAIAAHDGQDLVLLAEAAQQQLCAQRAQRLNLLAEGLISGDQLGAEAPLAGPQVGVIELTG